MGLETETYVDRFADEFSRLARTKNVRARTCYQVVKENLFSNTAMSFNLIGN